MNECLFCKIITGEVPSAIIYEDENYLGFLDINPSVDGHTLFIPKKHMNRLKDMEGQDIINFLDSFKKFIAKFEENISKDYNIVINQGSAAGQVIFHLHIHIVPRYERDEIKMPERKVFNEERAKEIINKMRLSYSLA